MSSLDTVRPKDGYKLLCRTIKMGRVEEALELIVSGAEVNFPQKLQHTPLHHAVSLSSHLLVSLLVSKGSNVNAKGQNGQTPLHLAKSPEIAKLLLNNGGLMDEVTLKEGHTPLYQAIVNKQSAVVEVLLEGGADVNYLSKNGETALSLAVSAGNNGVIDQVLKYNPDGGIPRNRDCLVNAAEEERFHHGHVSKELIEYGIGGNPIDNVVFLWPAAMNGYWNIVDQLLLQLKVSPPNINEAVLFDSIVYNVPHITDTMLSREDLLQFLNIDQHYPILNAAVLKLDIELTKKLIAKGADLNRLAIFGDTALFFLGYFPNPFIDVSKKVDDASLETFAELLMSQRANVNALTLEGKTPLHLAAGNGYHTLVEVLLKAKATVNAKDTSGNIPLHVAMLRLNVEVAEILLSHGADVNLRNNDNKTALDLICDHFNLHGSTERWVEIAKLVISHDTLKRAQQLNVDVCLHDHEAIKEFRLACENELAKLKIEKIGTSFLSFYNVLTKSKVSFAKCLANEGIMKILKSEATKEMFPIYESFLKKQLRTGLARKQLIDQSCQNSLYFFRLLPENCFEKIHDYLNEDDLKKLVEASCTINQ